MAEKNRIDIDVSTSSIDIELSGESQVIDLMANSTAIDFEVSTYTKDYLPLLNKPKINGKTLKGDMGPEDLNLTYVYHQNISSSEWIIQHPLNKYPSVTIISSAGDEIIGGVHYDSESQITLTFKGAFKGTAILN